MVSGSCLLPSSLLGILFEANQSLASWKPVCHFLNRVARSISDLCPKPLDLNSSAICLKTDCFVIGWPCSSSSLCSFRYIPGCNKISRWSSAELILLPVFMDESPSHGIARRRMPPGYGTKGVLRITSNVDRRYYNGELIKCIKSLRFVLAIA